MRRRRRIVLALLAIPPLLVVGAVGFVRASAAGDVGGNAAEIPPRGVAIVLGAQVRPDGQPSMMLAERVDAAVDLYRRGRVERLLLTGDNSTVSYDEVTAMRDRAMSAGVPAAAITLDYAGFDTYDSCWRARHLFGVTSAVVVTQAFHAPRAVFTCQAQGIDAVALGVPDWGRHPTGVMARLAARELVATVKALWEVEVARPLPVFPQ